MRWLIALLLLPPVSAGAQVVVGPLQAQNKLSEIAAAGSAAQTSARTNIGALGTTGDASGASVTANAQTRTLGTWMGYLSGTSNPNPVVFGNSLSVAGAMTGATTLSINPQEWVEVLRPYSTSISQAYAVSSRGKIGLLGASRCSDNPTSADMGCIGLEVLGNNDNSSYVQYGWGLYAEANRFAGAGTTQHELDIYNGGSVVDIAPGSGETVGNTFGLNLAAGAGRGGNDVSVGLLLWNNTARFRKGIMFGNDSLTNTGGYATAIAFYAGHRMEWYDASNAITGFITNNATTHAAPMGLVISDGRASITNNSLTPILNVNDAGSVQIVGHQISGGSTSRVDMCGTSPTITGNDTAGSIALGTGTVTTCRINFGTPYATAPRCFGAANTTDGTPLAVAATTISVYGAIFTFASNAGGGTLNYYCIQ